MGLRATGISYRAQGDHGPLDVLSGVDVSVASGEIVDIVGPSGSGKTTLLRALARLLPGSTGTLSLGDADSLHVPAAEWRSKVTLLPQVTSLMPGTVRDNLLLPWTLKARQGNVSPTDADLSEALARVGLAGVDLDRDTARLSVGQAARIALLRTLLTEPEVLLLDEPDASLDNDTADQVTKMTREFAESGGAVVRVRHLRSDQLATRRLHLEHGTLKELAE